MSTVDELLKDLPLDRDDESYITVDPDTRILNIPFEYTWLGVESDGSAKRVMFKFPRIVGDNIDLSVSRVYVNYINALQETNAYLVEDMQIVGSNVVFSWLLSRFVTKANGKVSFAISVKNDSDTEWHTRIAESQVYAGLDTIPDVESDNSDIIGQILSRLDMDAEELPKKNGQVLTANIDGSTSYDIPAVLNISRKSGCDIENGVAEISFYPEDDRHYFVFDLEKVQKSKIIVNYKDTSRIINNLITSESIEMDVKKSSIIGVTYNNNSIVIGVFNIFEEYTSHQVRVYSLTEKQWVDSIPDDSGIDVESNSELSNGTKVIMSQSDKEVVLNPNVLYVFPEMSSLSYTLNEVPTDSIAEFHIIFTSGSIMPTKITHPSDVRIPDGFKIEAGRIYEIRIIEKCLSYNSWTV